MLGLCERAIREWQEKEIEVETEKRNIWTNNRVLFRISNDFDVIPFPFFRERRALPTFNFRAVDG